MSSLHQASLSLHDPLMFVIGGGEASFYHNLMRFSSGLEYPTTTTTTTTSSSNSSYHHYNSSLIHNGDKAMIAFEDHHQDDLGMLPFAAVVADPTTRAKTPTDADAILAIDENNTRASTQHMPHQQQYFSASVVPTMGRRHLQDCSISSSSSSRSEVPTSSLMPNSSLMAKEPPSKPMPTNATGMGPPPAPSRYESQKRRDWNTFGQYLKNHRPPLALTRCSGAHVLEFLRYLDHFGKTKVHAQCCPFYGVPQPSGGCACPLRQAWGSLDALIGRLRAAFEENGGRPESNPFGARAVRLYLREVRDMQAKARGIAYQKKKKKKKTKLHMKHGSADPSAQSHPVAPLVQAPPAGNANLPHPHKNPNFILHYPNPTNLAATAYDNHILACNDPPPDHHDHDDPLFACLANH